MNKEEEQEREREREKDICNLSLQSYIIDII